MILVGDMNALRNSDFLCVQAYFSTPATSLKRLDVLGSTITQSLLRIESRTRAMLRRTASVTADNKTFLVVLLKHDP